MDEILLSRTVMFVGDYFTLMTTVVLDEKLRNEDEGDRRSVRRPGMHSKQSVCVLVLVVARHTSVVPRCVRCHKKAEAIRVREREA